MNGTRKGALGEALKSKGVHTHQSVPYLHYSPEKQSYEELEHSWKTIELPLENKKIKKPL